MYVDIERLLEMAEKDSGHDLKEAFRTLIRAMFMSYVDDRLFPEWKKNAPADEG